MKTPMKYIYFTLLVAVSMIHALHAETYIPCTEKIPVTAFKKQLLDDGVVQVRIGTPEGRQSKTISATEFVRNTLGRAKKLHFCFEKHNSNIIYVFYNKDKTKRFEPYKVPADKGQYGGKIIIDVDKATIDVKYNKPKKNRSFSRFHKSVTTKN